MLERFSLFLSFIFLGSQFLSIPLWSKAEISDAELGLDLNGGVPGQVLSHGSSKKIYFESSLSAECQEGQWKVLDKNQKVSLSVSVLGTQEKRTLREKLGEQIVEEDLGGTLKKQAPLAGKNLKVREVHYERLRKNPLKDAGMEPSKVEEQEMQSGKQIITQYPDESKSIQFISSDLKVESSYNRKGIMVWRFIEGSSEGVSFKRTQWEDGSQIQEYQCGGGTLVAVVDVRSGQVSFSVLNKAQETLGEVSCSGNGNCDLSE